MHPNCMIMIMITCVRCSCGWTVAHRSHCPLSRFQPRLSRRWDAYQTSFAIRVLEEPVLPYLPIHSAHLNLSPPSLHSTPHPDSFLIYLTLFNYDFTPIRVILATST